MKNNSIQLLILLSTFLLFSCNKNTDFDETINDITITSIKPTHGPFDTIDTLFGKGFDKIPVIDSVLINGKKLTLISKSNEQIVVKIPAMAGTGNIDIWYQGKLIRGPVFTYDSTLFVTTIAGSSTESGFVDGQGLNARFNKPQGIALDKSGNIYVADMYNNVVRKISREGNVTTLAGSLSGTNGNVDGTGSSAMFSVPYGLAIDNNENLILSDQNNYRIKKITLSGVVTTLAGNSWFHGGPLGGQLDGHVSTATFNNPFHISIDKHNNIFIADFYNNRIRKLSPDSMVSTIAGGDYYNYGYRDGPAATSLLFNPFAVTADRSGNIYFFDANNVLRKISADSMVSSLLGPIVPSLTGDSYVFEIWAMATDQHDDLYFAIRSGIVKLTKEGQVIRYALGGIGELDGPIPIASFRSISGITIDSHGTIYFTDNNRIRKIYWH